MMRLRRRTKAGPAGAALVVSGLLCGFPGLAGAQDGGTSSVFSIGAGSRAIASGRAAVATVDDASALYWNPAALRSVQAPELSVMYLSLFGDFTGASYSFAGFVYPTIGAGSFGAGFMRVGSTFDGFDAFSRPTGEFNYSESQFLFSYAFSRRSKWFLGEVSLGSSFKVSRIAVDPFSSTAPAFDLGVRWSPSSWREFSIGVNAQDIIASDHKLDVNADPVYRTVLAGAGYRHVFSGGARLTLMAQMDLPEAADSRTHFGAEFAFARILSLRAGMDDGNASFGVGVTVSRYGFDYALVSRDEAGSSHPVTFTTRFGRSLKEKRAAIAREREREEQELLRQAYEQRVAAHRTKARNLEEEGSFVGALDEWKIVLEFVPDDSSATIAAARVRQRILDEQAQTVRDAEQQAILNTRFAQGLDFFNAGDWIQSRAEWRAVLAIDSSHAGATDYLARTQARIDAAVGGHIARARALEQGGRLTEAVAEWNNVEQYDPGNDLAKRSVSRIRAQIEAASKDLAAARARLRVVTLYDEALTLYNAGEYARALEKLDALLRLKSDHEDARTLRALARRKLTPLTDEEKEEIRRLYLGGMKFFSRDEYARAIAEWEKILRIDPTNESVKSNIREARERLKRIGEENE